MALGEKRAMASPRASRLPPVTWIPIGTHAARAACVVDDDGGCAGFLDQRHQHFGKSLVGGVAAPGRVQDHACDIAAGKGPRQRLAARIAIGQ